MATGDSSDILARVKRELPNRWFAYVAPIRDAILGGLSDLSAWGYSFYTYAKQQSRLATSTGPFLDIIAYDFFQRNLLRNGSSDAAFLARIKALLFQERVTRAGMISALTELTGNPPIIIEPWNTGDCGGWDTGAFAWQGPSAQSNPGGGWDVASGWDTNASGFDIIPLATEGSGGAGCWGSTDMPGQVLIVVEPPSVQGVPYIGGWDSGSSGWDAPITEWIDDDMIGGPITDSDIYDTINMTRPTGVICWTQLP